MLPRFVVLDVDGVSYATASCTDCTAPQTFELDLSPGVHELRARAEFDFHGVSGEVVTVTVVSEDETTTGASTGASTGEEPTTDTDTDPIGSPSTGSTVPEDGNDGGGCSVGGSSDGPVGLGGLVMLLLATRRRRR